MVKHGVRSPKFFFGLHVQSFTYWLRSRKNPAFGLIYEGAMGQPESLCDPMVRTQEIMKIFNV
jgi:hypothetical protein